MFEDRPRWIRWLDDGSSFVFTRTLILRLLGVVYFVTFLGTALQGRALIGERGLLPMAPYLKLAGSFWHAPSLFWISASDAMLVGVAIVGAILAASIVLGVTNALVMLVLWVIQLSIYDVGQVFWGYGWEIQLLETGMIAAVACPLRTWRPFASAPPTITIWLFRWLIVRVMLGAGLIKLRGDSCWTELTCLVTHYETQPNPSPLSWVLHQAPPAVHIVGVVVNHFVELVVPFFVLGPRRWRRAAGVLFVAFQLLLIASGNLSFLNWLTIVPALACFDDAFFRRSTDAEPSRLHRRIAGAYAFVVGILSVGPVANLLSSHQAMNASFDPLHLVNTYGAFGSVNRYRDEIVIEGTSDGEHWEAYELPCKPGDPLRRPCLVSPYHYRLDWQMWFAAMASYDEEPWIAELADALLRGNHAMAPLFAKDPFPDVPPRAIRMNRYRYQLRGTGPAWWKRTLLGEYMRPMELGDPELAAFVRFHRLTR